MKETKLSRRPLARLAVFLLICLLVQGGICLLVSEPFAAWLYAADARLHAERVQPEEEGVLEYYTMHSAMTGSRLVAVGCDSGVGGTAELLLDLLAFVKRCTDACLIAVDLPEDAVQSINLFLEGEISLADEEWAVVPGVTQETKRLIEGICEMNALQPPAGRFSLISTSRSWSYSGTEGAPVLYLADRALGAEEMQSIERSFAGRDGLVTVDVCYQDCTRLAASGETEPLSEIKLPLAGDTGKIWLYDTGKLSRSAAYYALIVTHTQSGRRMDRTDAVTDRGGRFHLVMAGGNAALPLS